MVSSESSLREKFLALGFGLLTVGVTSAFAFAYGTNGVVQGQAVEIRNNCEKIKEIRETQQALVKLTTEVNGDIREIKALLRQGFSREDRP